MSANEVDLFQSLQLIGAKWFAADVTVLGSLPRSVNFLTYVHLSRYSPLPLCHFANTLRRTEGGAKCCGR